MIVITLEKSIAGFQHEAGGHRVQRTPPNEKRGRVHTSTVTCAVIDDTRPSASLFDQRHADDFEWRWHRGSGCGGQNRNKNSCCLELKHMPSGMTQAANGKSRERNSQEAMRALLARLDQQRDGGQAIIVNDLRSAQIGSDMRGKRRTYRFNENQIRDHKTGKQTSYSSFIKGKIDALWPQ